MSDVLIIILSITTSIFFLSLTVSLRTFLELKKYNKFSRKNTIENEIKQFKKANVDIEKIVDINKIQHFKIETNKKSTSVIRWTNNHKKIVIFLHGNTGDKYTSIKAVPLWNKLKYDVVSFDGYGSGEMAKQGTSKSFANLNHIKVLKSVLEFVLKKFQVTKVAIHGESLGGSVVYKYLEKFGAKNIEKILIDSSFMSLMNNLKCIYAKKGMKISFVFAMLTLWLFFLAARYPIRKQVSKKTLKKLPIKLLHINSKNDPWVPIEHINKYKSFFINNTQLSFFNKNVHHVKGVYEAPEEMFKFMKELNS